MRQSIRFQGHTFMIGDRLISNSNASKVGLCPAGTKVKIIIIRSDSVGLVADESYPGWGDLEGEVPPGCGLWQSLGSLVELFEKVEEKFVISSDIKYKNKNLKGMECKIIGFIDDFHCFVEVDQNVGGGGADGLGKKGHCVLVNSKILNEVPKPKAKTKKK